jgi:hypothetical protein
MHRIAVRWRVERFDCEVRNEGDVKWLLVYDGAQLVGRESVPSLQAGFERSREVARYLTAPVAKHA